MIYYDESIEDYRLNPCIIVLLFTLFIWGMAWVLVTIF